MCQIVYAAEQVRSGIGAIRDVRSGCRSCAIEAIEARNGNPFMEFSLPVAVLKFRQGVGRLIRTKSDEGIVVVLDSRVLTKRYGQIFLDSLPKCPTEIV